MNRLALFSVDEIRGRLLHEQLLAEAMERIERAPAVPLIEPPDIPHIATTDTGTMRAVVVAS